MQGSYFSAYKCYYQGAYAYYKTNEVRFTHMNMIDNRFGFGAALEAKFLDYDRIRIKLSDNKFYGETPILDCPPD